MDTVKKNTVVSFSDSEIYSAIFKSEWWPNKKKEKGQTSNKLKILMIAPDVICR